MFYIGILVKLTTTWAFSLAVVFFIRCTITNNMSARVSKLVAHRLASGTGHNVTSGIVKKPGTACLSLIHI